MKLVAALVAAAVTSLVLTAVVAVVDVATDPVIRDCAAASTAMDAANDAHQDAMRVLDNRFRRGGPPADMARLQVEQTKGELDAARAAFQLACHYQTDNPPSPTSRETR